MREVGAVHMIVGGRGIRVTLQAPPLVIPSKYKA